MVGLFIGSFNPPTKAHLDICLMLKDSFEKIVFVPVNTTEKHLVSFKKRVDMLNIYVRRFPFLEISSIMNQYSYFDYRILNLLKERYHDVEIIIGSDILANLSKFKAKDYLLENFIFHVITREKYNAEEIIKREYQDYQDKFYLHEYHSDISSSLCRDLIKKKQDLKNFLDDEIFSYIEENDLYF